MAAAYEAITNDYMNAVEDSVLERVNTAKDGLGQRRLIEGVEVDSPASMSCRQEDFMQQLHGLCCNGNAQNFAYMVANPLYRRYFRVPRHLPREETRSPLLREGDILEADRFGFQFCSRAVTVEAQYLEPLEAVEAWAYRTALSIKKDTIWHHQRLFQDVINSGRLANIVRAAFVQRKIETKLARDSSQSLQQSSPSKEQESRFEQYPSVVDTSGLQQHTDTTKREVEERLRKKDKRQTETGPSVKAQWTLPIREKSVSARPSLDRSSEGGSRPSPLNKQAELSDNESSPRSSASSLSIDNITPEIARDWGLPYKPPKRNVPSIVHQTASPPKLTREQPDDRGSSSSSKIKNLLRAKSPNPKQQTSSSSLRGTTRSPAPQSALPPGFEGYTLHPPYDEIADLGPPTEIQAAGLGHMELERLEKLSRKLPPKPQPTPPTKPAPKPPAKPPPQPKPSPSKRDTESLPPKPSLKPPSRPLAPMPNSSPSTIADLPPRSSSFEGSLTEGKEAKSQATVRREKMLAASMSASMAAESGVVDEAVAMEDAGNMEEAGSTDEEATLRTVLPSPRYPAGLVKNKDLARWGVEGHAVPEGKAKVLPTREEMFERRAAQVKEEKGKKKKGK